MNKEIHYAFVFAILPLFLPLKNLKTGKNNLNRYILKVIFLMFFLFILFSCAFKISIVANFIINLFKSHRFCISLIYFLILSYSKFYNIIIAHFTLPCYN